MSDGPPLIQMRGVTKAYPGTLAIDAVDFDVRAGEVHALMGENGAGKSTLMKLLAGGFGDYTGGVTVRGAAVRLGTPAAARAAGIAMVHQELSLAEPLSIAENLLAGRLPRAGGWAGRWRLDRRALRDQTRRWLTQVGLDADPYTAVEQLSPHERQLVEIAKALSTEPAVLVMDEPTSALSRREVERLFGLIDGLKRGGLGVVYISHHLPEVFRVADRVTVLRDGRRVASGPIGAFTSEGLVEAMVGRRVADARVCRAREPGAVRLKVSHYSRRGFFHDVSFALREGEILGVSGLAGAGRSELARALCGIDPQESLAAGPRPSIELDGAPYWPTTLDAALRRGLAYLPEDRKNQGLALLNTALQNVRSGRLAIARDRRGDDAGRRGVFDRLAAALQLDPPEPGRPAGQFSGGNQQKVLLAKWLAVDPKVLILDEPTRGVDVGAKQVIHASIAALADTGCSVVVVSSDLPELVALCGRAVVLRRGRVFAELAGDELTEDRVLLAANGERPARAGGAA